MGGLQGKEESLAAMMAESPISHLLVGITPNSQKVDVSIHRGTEKQNVV